MKKLLMILLLSIASFAQVLTVGDTLPTISLNDQFEKTHTISSNTKQIIVAYDKSMSDILKEFLLKKEGEFFNKKSNCICW